MAAADPQDWVGRREQAEDEISPRLIDRFNATFDRDDAPWQAGMPAPLGIHWCLCPPAVPQSALGADGHVARGGFLPPVALPRRMWAGGMLLLHDDLLAGDRVTRQSRIMAINTKQGRSGALCFVSVEHKYVSSRGIAIEERQDIVYRESDNHAGANPPATGEEAEPAPQWRVNMQAGPVMLFRYSALTFNSHRIHYDRDYATQVEHYPGLVVHGPLQATLLLAFAAGCGKAHPRQFSFRGLSALADFEPFSLNARASDEGMTLWAETPDHRRTMQALAMF